MVAGHPANMRQRRPGSSPEDGLTLSVERRYFQIAAMMNSLAWQNAQ
jgi:hypothetical protein